MDVGFWVLVHRGDAAKFRAWEAGGQACKPGSPAERARVNITRAIRGALSRIRAHSPALADHLHATIHTGTFCAYTPGPRAPITWHT